MNTDQFLLLPTRPQSLHEHWMWIALNEAIKAQAFTKPNPMVGAVIVSHTNEVISTGYHEAFGHDHAEIQALKNAAGRSLTKATLYTTLEPCCHTNKKTPPCLPEIISSGIKRVVVGTQDPNPQVMGKSISELKKHGIEVIENILPEQCRFLLREFFHIQTKNSHYLHLKIAMTLDGSFGTSKTLPNEKKWMTNEKAKNYVHWLRAMSDAILIGGTTLSTDNPILTCRLSPFCEDKNFRQPKKILLSKKHLHYPKDYIPLKSFEDLAALPPQRILVEAGPKLASHFLENGLFNELSVILTPKLLGNSEKILFNSDFDLSEALNLAQGQWYNCGDNILFHWVQPN